MFEERKHKALVTVQMRRRMGRFGSVTFTEVVLLWICLKTF